MKTGIELIAEERRRQIEIEGWTSEHDDDHIHGELAQAAAVYALPSLHRPEVDRKFLRNLARGLAEPDRYIEDTAALPKLWPWNDGWNPCPDDRRRELIKAGALIAAELDRLQRRMKPTSFSERFGEDPNSSPR